MIKQNYLVNNKATKKHHRGKKRKFEQSNPADNLEFFDVINKNSSAFQDLLNTGKIVQSPTYQIWCQLYKSFDSKSLMELLKQRKIDLASLKLKLSELSRPEVPLIPTLTDTEYSNLLYSVFQKFELPIRIPPKNLTRDYWLQLTSTLNNSNSLSSLINNILVPDKHLQRYIQMTLEIYKSNAHISQMTSANEHKSFFRQLVQLLMKHPDSSWQINLPIENIAKLSSIIAAVSAISGQTELFMNVPLLIDVYFKATGIESDSSEYLKVISDLLGIDLMWVRKDKRTFDAFRNQLQAPSEFAHLKHYFLYFQQDLEIAYSLWKTPFDQKALTMNSAQTMMVLTELEFCRREESLGFLSSNFRLTKTAKRFLQSFLPSKELQSKLQSLITNSKLAADRLWFYTLHQDMSIVKALFPFSKLFFKVVKHQEKMSLFDPVNVSSLFLTIGEPCPGKDLQEFVELPELNENDCYLISSDIEVRKSLLQDQLSSTFKTNCFDFWDPKEEAWKRMNSSFAFMISSCIERKDIEIKSKSFINKVEKLEGELEIVKLNQLETLSNKIRLLNIPLSLLNREIILTLKASVTLISGEPFNLLEHSYQILNLENQNDDYRVTLSLKNKKSGSHHFTSQNAKVEIQFSLFQTICSFLLTIPKREEVIPNKYLADPKAKLYTESLLEGEEVLWKITSSKFNLFSIDKSPENVPFFELKSPVYLQKDRLGKAGNTFPSFPSIYHDAVPEAKSEDSFFSNGSSSDEEVDNGEKEELQEEFLEDWDAYQSEDSYIEDKNDEALSVTPAIFSKAVTLKMKFCYLNLKQSLILNLGTITENQLIREGKFYYFNSQNDLPLDICQSRMLLLHMVKQKKKDAFCPWWSLELPSLKITLNCKKSYLCPFLYPTKTQDLLEIPATIYSIGNEFFVHGGGKAYITHQILNQEGKELFFKNIPNYRYISRGFNEILLTDRLFVRTYKVNAIDPHHNETPLNPFRFGKIYFSPLDFIETMHLLVFKRDNDSISYSPQNTMISNGKFLRNISIEKTKRCDYDRKSFADWNFKQFCEQRKIFITKRKILLKFETSSTKLSDIHHDLIQFLLSIPLGRGESVKLLDNPADGIFLESDKLTKADLEKLEQDEKEFLSNRDFKYLEVKTSTSPYAGTRNISKFIYNDMEKVVASSTGMEFSSLVLKRLKQTIPGTSLSYLELLMCCNKREFDFRLNSPHLRLDNISKLSFQDRRIWGPSDLVLENTSNALYEQKPQFLEEPQDLTTELGKTENLSANKEKISLKEKENSINFKIRTLEDFDKYDFENMSDDELDKIDFELPEPPPKEPNYEHCKHYPQLEQDLDLLKDSIVNKKLMIKEIFKASPIEWFKTELIPDGKGGWREMTKEELEDEYGDFGEFEDDSEQ